MDTIEDFQGNDRKMWMVVDTREQNDKFMETARLFCAANNIDFSEETLKCGDIKMSNVLVERKTIPDFIQSMMPKRTKDGGMDGRRLIRQMNRMMDYAHDKIKQGHEVIPAVLISEDDDSVFGSPSNELQEIEMYNESLQELRNKGIFAKPIDVDWYLGCRASLDVAYSMPIHQVANDDILLQMTVKLNNKVKNKGLGERQLVVPLKYPDPRLTVIATVLRCNKNKAQKFIDKFGSLDGLFHSSIEDMEEIKGVGLKTAEKMYNFLHT